jgi:hypothetical protein
LTSFNGNGIYDLPSARKLTKLSLSLSLAQLSPSLFLIFIAKDKISAKYLSLFFLYLHAKDKTIK